MSVISATGAVAQPLARRRALVGRVGGDAVLALAGRLAAPGYTAYYAGTLLADPPGAADAGYSVARAVAEPHTWAVLMLLLAGTSIATAVLTRRRVSSRVEWTAAWVSAGHGALMALWSACLAVGIEDPAIAARSAAIYALVAVLAWSIAGSHHLRGREAAREHR